MPDPRRSLIDRWLWEAPALRVFVPVAAAVPVLVCGILLPFVGPKALFALIFLCFAPIFGIVYRVVGKRVDLARDSVSQNEGTMMPALIVQGMIQSPGVVTVGPESLTLRPIAGDRADIRIEDIASVREVRWFNGTLLVGKTGFWLTVPGHSRLGCAVPDSCAAALRTRLLGSDRTAQVEACQ